MKLQSKDVKVFPFDLQLLFSEVDVPRLQIF